MSYGGEDTEEQFKRMMYLEELYLLDGRDKLDHPQRGLFTGLLEKYGKRE